MTLVILAAGMGSRFGGLKQIEPVGPNGEFIIDYAIYDAIEAGFTKVVFIIKEENYELFRDTIGSRIADKIKVEYTFQGFDKIPDGVVIPEGREKPLGTAHALYSAIPNIDESFGIINADDFYGKEAYKQLSEVLSESNNFAIIGYEVGKTLSENGQVKRGVCFNEKGVLTDLIESKIGLVDDRIVCEPLNGGESFEIPFDQPVSMQMFAMRTGLLEFLKRDINRFFDVNKNNMEVCEYLLPDLLNDYAKSENLGIHVMPTKATWKGITYRDELEDLKEYIKGLIDEGVYPTNLY